MFLIWFLLIVSATTALAALLSVALNPSSPTVFTSRWVKTLAMFWCISAAGEVALRIMR